MTHLLTIMGSSDQKRKILVADDSLTIQKVIRLALSGDHYDIQTVSDGADAIEQMSLFQPSAVLIDVSLPSQSATEIAKAAQEHADLKDVQFILMSSAFEKVDESKMDMSLFSGKLVKPFDPSHLREVLDQCFEKEDAPETVEHPVTPPEFTPPPRPEQKEEPASEPEPPQESHSISLDAPSFSESAIEFEETQLEEKSDVLSDDEDFQISPEAPPETDIKKLTDSTMQMSGLDGWAIQDESAKKELETEESTDLNLDFSTPENDYDISPISDQEETLPNMAGDRTLVNLQSREPEIEPPKNMQLPTDATVKLDFTSSERSEDSTHTDITPPPSPQPKKESPNVIPVPGDEMEAAIQQQIQKKVSEFTETVLPQIAEKVIREEIHRLLSNPPE